jgi:hypothetical protein
MELDDLKTAWKSLEARLDRQRAFDLQMLTESRVEAARRRLFWFTAGRWLSIAIAVAVILLGSNIWVHEHAHPWLLASGLTFHAYGVALLCSSVMELLIALRIRNAAPVVTMQKSLAHLRTWRARMLPWLALAHWILWVPAVLILFRILLGVDLGAEKPLVVLSFLASGTVGLAASLWLLHGSPPRLRARVRTYVDGTQAGAAIAAAQGLLDEIDRFAAE